MSYTMRPYRQIRTITGRKIFVRETAEERRNRIILRAEIIIAPLLTIFVFAVAGGMIRWW